jgi:hypothetical protein
MSAVLSSAAPDLIEFVVGFRQWELREGGLVSPFTREPWSGALLTARCRAGELEEKRA